MGANDDQRRLLGLVIAIVLAVTVIRVATLVVSPLDLYPDEAQYWWWAQTPDIGYFSKPPMIAWIIRATTLLFGDREWAIRIGMPLLHAAASLLLYGIARTTFPKSPAVAFWSVLAYLTLPGISYSATLASTDAPLLFFWALTLYAFLRAAQSQRWSWTVLFGAALGFGILSKYAMLFFLPGVALCVVANPGIRRFVIGPRGLCALAIAALVVTPNIVWNASHAYVTIAHTRTNAGWGHANFNPLNLLIFVAGQFGVFGPVLMAAWLAWLYRIARDPGRSDDEVALTAFSLPTLAVIMIQALISGANGNWAATTYVAAVPLAIAELMARWPRAALRFSFGLHGFVLAVLCLVTISPRTADRLGLGDVIKREEGWQALSSQVLAVSKQESDTIVAAGNRSITAELLYYTRRQGTVIRIWDADFSSHNHFDMTMRLTPPASRVLLVLGQSTAPRVLASFESAKLVAIVPVAVGGREAHGLGLYDARNYRGPLAH